MTLVWKVQRAGGADAGENPRKHRGDTSQGDNKFFEWVFWLCFLKRGIHGDQQDATQEFWGAPSKEVWLHFQPPVGEVLCPREHLGQQQLQCVQTFHLWETCWATEQASSYYNGIIMMGNSPIAAWKQCWKSHLETEKHAKVSLCSVNSIWVPLRPHPARANQTTSISSISAWSSKCPERSGVDLQLVNTA